MEVFKVTFLLRSFYEDPTNNLSTTERRDFEAATLQELFELLDDEDVIETLDDTPVINAGTNESPDEINIEYVLIHDSNGDLVYRDEHHTE